MSTFFVKPADLKDKKWHVVDASGQVVGRLATKISRILSGKTKTDYTPHTEMGDGVIVINAAKSVVTGNKAKDKNYKFYSGFPGGQREKPYEDMMKQDPTYPLMHAVKGMLPKSRLGKSMITRLLIYADGNHPHQAQTTKKGDAPAKGKK